MSEEFKRVSITWLDAVHMPEGWKTLAYYREQARNFARIPHYTTGYLIEETNEYVAIALDIRTKVLPIIVNMVQVVHKEMITSMAEVKEVEELPF